MHYLIRFALLLSMLIGENVYAEPISLREKIGQMLILGFEGKSVDLQSPIIKAIKEILGNANQTSGA